MSLLSEIHLLPEITNSIMVRSTRYEQWIPKNNSPSGAH